MSSETFINSDLIILTSIIKIFTEYFESVEVDHITTIYSIYAKTANKATNPTKHKIYKTNVCHLRSLVSGSTMLASKSLEVVRGL